MRDPYHFVYKLRGILMVPPAAFAMLVSFHETQLDAVRWPLGLGVFLLGVFVRVWAQMHLHYRLRTRKHLTMTGPYAIVRNPIYIANTLILLALTILSGLLWFVPVMLVWCMTVYHFVVRREEAHLLKKYGAPYANYLDTAPRWLPRMAQNGSERADVAHFLAPSIVAELHCLLWLLPVIGKEAILG
ncbi:MAG: hypothetical protein GWP08_11230 [Nitrospiraceae bacterium]|nr:hypothetical protein [Nitrospiraceae bacterium]